jgi:hypothetical protein
MGLMEESPAARKAFLVCVHLVFPILFVYKWAYVSVFKRKFIVMMVLFFLQASELALNPDPPASLSQVWGQCTHPARER